MAYSVRMVPREKTVSSQGKGSPSPSASFSLGPVTRTSWDASSSGAVLSTASTGSWMTAAASPEGVEGMLGVPPGVEAPGVYALAHMCSWLLGESSTQMTPVWSRLEKLLLRELKYAQRPLLFMATGPAS